MTPPVIRSAWVPCDAATAFEAFTEEIGAWWPLPTHGVFGHRSGGVSFDRGRLVAAGQAILSPGREIVYAWPSFSIYPTLAPLNGGTEVRVPLAPGDFHDLPAMLERGSGSISQPPAKWILTASRPAPPKAPALRR